MNLFIAGICGTFMSGIAQLARELGHRVTGCDASVYPPMSDVLSGAGIQVRPGYDPDHVDADTDQVIMANILSRGNPLVEAVLNSGMMFRSGPAWLAENILPNYRVIAVAGTHGKTSTASMITWILQYAGQAPGFLIGGKPGNFQETARLGNGSNFVIEADEYDTAFFDKRSKFLHYHPRIVVLNNLEFDHADIFDDLPQIQRQFHHLIRTIPGNGSVVMNHDDANLAQVMAMGLWSKRVGFSLNDPLAHWHAIAENPSANRFRLQHRGKMVGTVQWDCIGRHNMENALAAVAAVAEAGVDVTTASQALAHYRPNARRLQCLFQSSRVTLLEDFAHHPTAIARTLEAVRTQYPDHRLIALIEPRSNTMRLGHAPDIMGHALSLADETILYLSHPLSWDPSSLPGVNAIHITEDADQAISLILERIIPRSVIVIMSNGQFAGIPKQLEDALKSVTL